MWLYYHLIWHSDNFYRHKNCVSLLVFHVDSQSSEKSANSNDMNINDVHALRLQFARLNVDWWAHHIWWLLSQNIPGLVSPHYSTSVFTLSADLLAVNQVREWSSSTPALSHSNREMREADTVDTKERPRWTISLRFAFCFAQFSFSAAPGIFRHAQRICDFHSAFTIWVFALVLNLPCRALLSSAHIHAEAANYNCNYIYLCFHNYLLLVERNFRTQSVKA